MFLLYERGDRGEVLRLADVHLELANKHGLAEQLAYVGLFRGWARRDPEEIKRNLAIRVAAGNNMDRTAFSCILAEVEADAGFHDAALERLDDSLKMTEEFGEPCYVPKILRRKGLVLLARDPGAHEAAEACFQRAITVAKEQGAKMHELQATTALCRVLLAKGQLAAARDILAPLYAWFTEGFDAPPLADARAVLDEIESSPSLRA
jgi:adenylate cyclase